ncbi:unnamed protein product [Adineta steineri]|uniref:Uncharacterized protein n=1 Tax=Adineta steineri TaxID=433720 RepID=A0A815JBH9_9BILA|nr:unnamed protein product [Adineta steineri]CAF1375736.1 unnamed protein product [Adineta steineri]CAF1601213.1 unnamed protein product [Adineta steineri]CAF1605633.1 unnamed protein product [Adineta steineri]
MPVIKNNNNNNQGYMFSNNPGYTFSNDQYYNRSRNHSENVIAYLVASYTGDAVIAYNPYPKLYKNILLLSERLNDSNTTDFIIFHTGYPGYYDYMPLIEKTTRLVIFINIDNIFYKFSPTLNPYTDQPTWTKRGKWNYQHMCYFWFKQVFEMKIIQRYRYMMRLDDDSQIAGQWPNVFDMMSERQAIYMANYRTVDYEYVLPGLTRVRNLTVNYIAKNKIKIQNPAMYADLLNNSLEIPNYWNNFEIIEISLMRRNDVMDFIRAVDESNGIFLYRWGDASLRYITLALFVNESQILHRIKLDLGYCHPC